MTTKYGKHYSTRQTPQSEPIPGSTQVPNSAGGFAWAVDDWTRLDRFLVLGTEGGSYYASEKKLTIENAQAVHRCLQADGSRTVRRIVEISKGGRAPKNDAAIFALAMAAGLGDATTKAEAFIALPEVCRIGTHLFQFAEAAQAFRGWGRGLRRAIQRWYVDEPNDVAYQVIKYVQRQGWTHKDLLRLAHPNPPTSEHKALFNWIIYGLEGTEKRGKPDPAALPRVVHGVLALKAATTAKDIAALIREYNLPREAVETADTKWLKEPDVWAALLEKMPMTAMIRTLNRMSAVGLLADGSEAAAHVVRELSNQERLRKARIHPIGVLTALLTYSQGHGTRGLRRVAQGKELLTWNPVRAVVEALDAAFYLTFQNVEPTGKRLVLALDVSGSMASGAVAGVEGLTPRMAAAALALVTASREPHYTILGFTSKGTQAFKTGAGRYGYMQGDGISVLKGIKPGLRLDHVVKATDNLPFGGTDCALPMLWALQEKHEADAFVILTDSETWAGSIHPTQALQQYRREHGIPAKLVVVGMVSSVFSIADPNDAGMLDVVGFDTATPNLISQFVGDNGPGQTANEAN